MTNKMWFNSSEYTEEGAIESIFDLEYIKQIDNLVDSKSINTVFKRKQNVRNLFSMEILLFLFESFVYYHKLQK